MRGRKLPPLNLQFFAEEVTEPGVEPVPAAGEQQTEQQDLSIQTQTTGVDSPAAAEPQNNIEKAFAKRLSDAQAKWEAEVAEKYKDYDVLKEIASFVQEQLGADPLTIKEQIEMVRLQQRAEREGISPELQKRLEALEEKARKADEFEAQRQQLEQYAKWRGELESFAKSKEIDADAFEQFMRENQIGNFEVAYKAFKYDEIAKTREEIEKEAVKKFLESKKNIPKVESANGAKGQVIPDAPKSFTDARNRALQRLANWGNMEG
jgi:acyl carrier protein